MRQLLELATVSASVKRCGIVAMGAACTHTQKNHTLYTCKLSVDLIGVLALNTFLFSGNIFFY